MEPLDKLIFDAIIKLRNKKKQPNENSIRTLVSSYCKLLRKRQLEERLLTLTKENNIRNRPSAGKKLLFHCK